MKQAVRDFVFSFWKKNGPLGGGVFLFFLKCGGLFLVLLFFLLCVCVLFFVF